MPSSTLAAPRAASAWLSDRLERLIPGARVSRTGTRVQRLKTRAQFQAVLACDTVARSTHFALHRLMLDDPESMARSSANTGPGLSPEALFVVGGAGSVSAPQAAHKPVWIGALIPKRWARRAVTRNAIRRQVYAVSAAYEGRLPRAAHVVRLRSAFDRREFISASSESLKRAVRAELEQLLARACR